MTSSHHFDVKNLYKSYLKRQILKGVSLLLRPGEIVGLLGPNGAGKTTCFSILCGLVRCDKGQVIVNGYNITNLPIYQRSHLGIGYLPQDISIFRGLSVFNNIKAVVEILGIVNTHKQPLNNQEIEDRTCSLLDKFHLTHLRKNLAITLSGGERRRLEIARCLATSPQYLLLDEPFTGIDPIAVGDVRQILIELKEEGIGILITDHNVRETLDLVDRAYIIADGKVIADGSPQDIVNNDLVRRVYLGERFTLPQ